MRRTAVWSMLLGVPLVLGALAAAWFRDDLLASTRAPIRVGLIHSQTGPLAVSEASMLDGEVLALEEIRARGGLLGRPIEWVVADGGSDPATFGREAERLIRQEKVSVIIGGYTSESRRAMKAVVESAGHLLIYPSPYEGAEASQYIVYTGGAPNQQIMPAVSWCFEELKARSFFLIGSNDLYSRAGFTIVKDQLKALGGRVAGELYLGGKGEGLDEAIAAMTAAKPDVVLSTVTGDANLAFYKSARGEKKVPLATPLVSFVNTEEELRHLPASAMGNDYIVCNYLQSIARTQNTDFVRRFKARFGQDRVTSDQIDTAYNSVRFWAQAVQDAETDETRIVRLTILRQTLDAPEGVISIDRETRHTWRPFYLGKVRPDGQIEIATVVPKPVRPVPFPFSRTRSEWEAEFRKLAEDVGRGIGPVATSPTRPSPTARGKPPRPNRLIR